MAELEAAARQLACQLPSVDAGEITLHVSGSKGANVDSVTNMSLNFRKP